MDSRGSYWNEGPATAVAEQPLPLSADKKKPVLVTGAAGLVGIHTCRELSKNGWQVRALIRDPARAAMALGQLPVEFRVGDAPVEAVAAGAKKLADDAILPASGSTATCLARNV